MFSVSPPPVMWARPSICVFLQQFQHGLDVNMRWRQQGLAERHHLTSKVQ